MSHVALSKYKILHVNIKIRSHADPQLHRMAVWDMGYGVREKWAAVSRAETRKAERQNRTKRKGIKGIQQGEKRTGDLELEA
mmetsp:Transcript_44351/g.115260  ORF Transcript_44351/g.115260 Transcript_44351/m.115260 type:complete len:82 (-) Transcript_44351:77-322(-)